MIRGITDIYSYNFVEDGDIYAYFSTKTGTIYSAYFHPADGFDFDTPLLNQNGYHFGFTKVGEFEGLKEPVDFRVRNTIVAIINDFYDEHGIQTVLIFTCESDDGKHKKRASCFSSWYDTAETRTCFKKHDLEIVVMREDEEIKDINYVSLILECSNPNVEVILQELYLIKNSLIGIKN